MQNHFISPDKKHFVTLVLKRFFAIYLFLYSLPFPLSDIPFLTIVSKWYYQVVNKMVVWTGTTLCGVPAGLLTSSDGSSDTTYNYIRLALFVIASAIVLIAWSTYKPLTKFLNLALPAVLSYVRYYLAFTLLRYGFEKIIKAQFPFPYFNLNETYGQSSPLRLFKSFMGFSPAYNVFLGLSEATAALLLLFKKTKVFGALLSIVILLNIVVLNFTFDLSVKLVSLTLLLMSFFVLLTERALLLTVYTQIRLAVAKNITLPVMYNRQQKIWAGVKFVVLVCILYSLGFYTWNLYRTSGDGAFERAPLSGIYNTELFIKNGDTLPPLFTDAVQWRSLNIGGKQQASLRMMNDSIKYCRLMIDTTNKTIRINDKEDTSYKSLFSYSFQDTSRLVLVLRGRIKEDSVYVVLRKQDYNQYRLINRGFHWVSEYPYNK